MIDLIEERLDVGIEPPQRPPVGTMPDRFEGSQSRAPRSEPVTRFEEVRLEHGFEDDLGDCDDNPVTDAWDTEGPGGARLPRLGDIDSPQRLRAVLARLQLGSQPIKELTYSRLLNVVDGHAVDAGSPLVGTDLGPRSPQHVAAGDFVEEGMEPLVRFLPGTAREHSLESSDTVHTFGAADGPSRSFGTHQIPLSSLLHR